MKPFVAAGNGEKLKVIGCGIPIGYELDKNSRFQHGANDIVFPRMTIREVSMLGIMEALTDKPDWYKKIFDDTIISKWREEAMNMPFISEKTWAWCVQELQDKARDYEATKLTTVLDMGSRCVKADELVPKDLQDALKTAVKPLLDQRPQDWHPGSGERVLNLVHPSLYPVVYGRTRVSRHNQISIDESLAPHDGCVTLTPSGQHDSEVDQDDTQALPNDIGPRSNSASYTGLEHNAADAGEIYRLFVGTGADLLLDTESNNEIEDSWHDGEDEEEVNSEASSGMAADSNEIDTLQRQTNEELVLLEDEIDTDHRTYPSQALLYTFPASESLQAIYNFAGQPPQVMSREAQDLMCQLMLLGHSLPPPIEYTQGQLSEDFLSHFRGTSNIQPYRVYVMPDWLQQSLQDGQGLPTLPPEMHNMLEDFPEEIGDQNEEDDYVSRNGEIGEGAWSFEFQWLPCDVSFTNDVDNSVKIDSYVNNLHPQKYRPLYHIIESMITLSIPAWNRTLVEGGQGQTPIRIKVNDAETDPPKVPEWTDSFDPKFNISTGIHDAPSKAQLDAGLAKVREYWNLPDNPDNAPWFDDLEEDWQAYPSTGVEWKWRRLRKVIHPEPGVAPLTSYADWKAGLITDSESNKKTFTYRPIDLHARFRTAGLQVIVKLASIELTPSNPSYPGGNWHLEGMTNEHIVATSIYYFDVQNITPSRIRFRQEAFLRDDMAYEQGDHAPLCQVFGVPKLRDEPAIQEIGSVATPDGRLLAFPNTLQHKVEPFTLADPTQPGHRRFLVLWLVDPNYRVLSTANVPPQQHEWWMEKMREILQGRFSNEILGLIGEQLRDGTMTLEEAKKYRLELMRERTAFNDGVIEGLAQYDFCEH